MSEQFKTDSPSAPPQVEPDITALLKQMQQQIGFLEKKIDILIKQSSERPSSERSFNKRPFSRPFRPGGFSHSHRPNEREYKSGPSDRNPAQGQPFDKPQGNANRDFGRGRKAFFRRRKEHAR
ncbi:MAG: hypothetical protein A3C35_01990 [Omnitrophica bacterium RIFCSPHIGHO2_02_FULL_46_11]|nr:MAG: hypothetical protein A3C35_01990 [Omnitrophica bacterium RIFCSPHIGHO2_02_FULL_46_11]OGW87456.1 MAG: hypothetical protein A3A81_05795 [Omnitrophica bacterium RIFCSPLOWO2_01_FULL_45_10b]